MSFRKYMSRGCACVIAIGCIAVGCGYSTGSVGEHGRLKYALSTDYDVPESGLTEARIVTQHPQRIRVSFAEEDHADTGGGSLVHRVTPSAGVTLSSESGLVDKSPDIEITVTTPGVYSIESLLDGAVFDRISLHFAEPESFELLLEAREPYATRFRSLGEQGAVVECVEGTQVTVDAAPLDAAGRRLAGKIQTRAAVDPAWAAVPGVGVIRSYEGGVWKIDGEANVYFIEEGRATLTVSDPVTGASHSATFDVSPIPKN